MGHAHKSDKAMDWEAFGYLLQTVLSETEPPIFIQHKLQYIEAADPIVNEFLKGKKVPKEKLRGLNYCAPS